MIQYIDILISLCQNLKISVANFNTPNSLHEK